MKVGDLVQLKGNKWSSYRHREGEVGLILYTREMKTMAGKMRDFANVQWSTDANASDVLTIDLEVISGC